MFDQIFGLPAHALIIHAAVALTPLLALLSVAYAAVPRIRPRIDWAVVVTALGAPVAVFAAKESGEALEEHLFSGNPPASVALHETFAQPLLLSTAGLAVAALALVYLTRPRREPAPAAGAGAVTWVVTAAAVILAVVAAYYAVRAGHSGATAVWGG
ncbi:DUF2231 domain-containing protein [Microbispora sp. NPDC049125]|uniref:DUF2231 domain-containing protein n=1 Tax=Microbispora sp. NPDC049125 TaxID=3154929 RepID=UPI0034651DF5